MTLPPYTHTFHHTTYPSISPLLPSLSTRGKIIVITGAGSGLGPSLAHSFAQSGSASIALLGRTASTLSHTASSLSSSFPSLKILTIVTDISSSASVENAFQQTRKELGKIDVLVSNAAYLPAIEGLGDGDGEEVKKGLEVNVLGNLNLASALLRNGAEGSVFVHVTTAVVHVPPFQKGMGGYVASKLAALKILEYFAFENPSIRMMFVHPGLLATAMSEKATKDIPKSQLILELDDLELPSNFIVWAVSSEAAFLQGKFLWANWDVDELKAKKEELLAGPQLTIGLLGWP